MRRPAILLTVLVLSGSVAAQTPPTVAFDPDLGARLAEEYIAPATLEFADTADALASATETLCASPAAESLAAARAAFEPTVTAWGAIWLVRFGPLLEDNRADRVFLWPDPRGIGLRQIQAFLADPATASITAADLPAKSVALQGIPALDFILFGTGAETLATADGTIRCAAARAIAGNLATIAEEIAAAWAPGGPFEASFAAPGAENSTYRSPEEVAREALKAATNGLEFIRDGQIAPAIGDTPESANGRLAPLWRSQATYRLVVAEIDAIRNFLDASRFADLLPSDQAWLGQSIDFELKAAAAALARIEVEPEQAVTDGEARGTLTYASIALASVRVNVVNIAAALGLGTGFSAAEGGD